jgi:hypothetical protein
VIIPKTFWSGVLGLSLTTLYSVDSRKRIIVDLWKVKNQSGVDTNVKLAVIVSGNLVPMAEIKMKAGYSMDVLGELEELVLSAGDSILGTSDQLNSISGLVQGKEESPV